MFQGLRVSLVAAALLGAGSSAADAEPSPSDAPSTPASVALDAPPSTNYWVPALEVAAFNVALSGYLRATGREYAEVTPSSMWRNIRRGWKWDDDQFYANQFRHPYLGALYFTSARSSGVGFWGAAAYTTMGSVMWEYLMETEHPSINDQIFTMVGGTILGEGMHRFASALLWNGARGPSSWRRVLAGIISPVRAVNRHLLSRRSLLTAPPAHFATLGIGFNSFLEDNLRDHRSSVRAFNQLHLALSATYGLPGDHRFSPGEPMGHLDISAELDVSEGKVLTTLFLRGLVAGRSYDWGRLRGLWGIFAGYDFFNPTRVRVGVITTGLGTTAQRRLGRRGFLQGTLIYSAVPFGAAGVRENVDSAKDYHWGPGVSQLFELKIGRAETGVLRFVERSYAILGSPFQEGNDLVTHVTLEGQARVWGRHALGAGLVFTARRATFGGADTAELDTAAHTRVFYTFLSDTTFGAVLDW